MERVEIPINKTKTILMLIGCIILIISCIWIVINPEFDPLRRFIGGIGILFFGYGALKLPKLLSVKLSALVIDENGITDNVTKPHVGLIRWEDIDEINLLRLYGNKNLRIQVKNPEEYLKKISSMGLRNNYKLAGTPFIIPFSLLKMDATEILKLANERLELYNSK